MAELSPNGFVQQMSWSSSSMAQAGIVEFPYPPFLHGFANDVAITTPVDKFGYALPSTTTPYDASLYGFIFPYPISTTNADFTFYPVIGVITGFKYQPLSQNGVVISASNYLKDTPLMPGTGVTALVQTDLQNIYKVQATGDTPIPTSQFPSGYSADVTGVPSIFLFSNGLITAAKTYTITAPPLIAPQIANYSFAEGDKSFGGVSNMSITLDDGVGSGPGPVSNFGAPANIMGVAPGSIWSAPDVSVVETNPYLYVRLQSGMWAYVNAMIYV
jgi:hypothetical protein